MEDKKSQKREHKEAESVTSSDQSNVQGIAIFVSEQVEMKAKNPNTLKWGNRSFDSGLLLSKTDAVMFFKWSNRTEE